MTSVRTAGGPSEELYLHAGADTFRLTFPSTTPPFAAFVRRWSLAQPPLGPAYLLSVTGMVSSETDLPSLAVETVTLVRGEQRSS